MMTLPIPDHLAGARTGRRRVLCLTLFLGLLTSAPSSAFVLQTENVDGQLRHMRWPPRSRPVPFVVNDRSFQLLPNRPGAWAPLPAIEAALRAWSVPPVELYLDGTVRSGDYGEDGMNLIGVAHTLESLAEVANYKVLPVIWRNLDQGAITEADIILNPEYRFATDGAPDARDLQNHLAYALAWTLGLDSSPIAAASTYNENFDGQIYKRSLEPDDIAGLRALYGGASDPRRGAIAGRVLVQKPSATGTDEPVFGAHVVATDAAGVVQVGALTDWDGRFLLPDLPAGTYAVFAEPLDGPTTPGDLDDAYRDARREFRTLFVGGNDAPSNIEVKAGAATFLETLRVEPESPRLNPDWITWAPDGEGFRNGVAQALQIAPGEETFLVVGGQGIASVPRSGFSLSGGDISVDASRIRRDLSDEGYPYAILPIKVRPGAVRGARNLYLTSVRERAAFTGCIEVVAR